MKEYKKLALRIFLLIEICIFVYIYFYGKHGLRTIKAIDSSNKTLAESIELLQNNIQKLENELAQWHTDMFYKQKVAREQLLMAYPDEELYRI